MENVSSTLSTPLHAYAADALFRARTTALTDTNPTVVLTSVLTQTVHPTLVLTESTVVTPDPVTVQTTMAQPGTSAVETSQSDTHQTTRLGTARSETTLQQTTRDTSPATPTSTTTSTSPAEEQTTALSTEGFLGYLNANASISGPVSDSPVTESSSSSSTSLVVSTSTSSSILSIVTSSSSSTEISATITQLTSMQLTPTSISPSNSPTSSPTTSQVTHMISGSTSTQGSPRQTEHNSTNVGAIVGGTVGGATFIALGVLACCFFIRRKGHTTLHRRHISGQGLLGSHPSSPIRSLEISEPTLPIVQPPAIPSAPAFPARRYSNPLTSHPVPESTTSHTADNHHPENPFADPKNSPVSPIVEVQAPSNTASIYSRASWESVQKLLELSSRHTSYESTTNPGKSSLATPSNNGSKSFKYTRDTICSTRSDPFDLELPPNVLPNVSQKWPLP